MNFLSGHIVQADRKTAHIQSFFNFSDLKNWKKKKHYYYLDY